MRVPALSVLSAVAVMVAVGCSVGAPRESPIRPTPLPDETRPPSSSSAAPSPSPVRSSAPSGSGSPASPVATNTSTGAPTPWPAPPIGSLDAGSGAVEGWLGSYCWQALCADVPAILPKEQLPTLTFGTDDLGLALDGSAPFVRWFASYGPNGRNLEPLAKGGAPFDPDAASSSPPPQLTSATFARPPDGDWVLEVQVFFTDGDATYAWHAVSE